MSGGLQRDVERRRDSWFDAHGGVALFVLGAGMVIGGLVQGSDPVVASASFFVGAALAVLGVLMPRLSGQIRITPGSVELTVLQRLEATREEAERRAPDRVEEAVGRAFRKLVDDGLVPPSLLTATSSTGMAEQTETLQDPVGPTSPTASTTATRRARAPWLVAAVLAVALAGTVGVVSDGGGFGRQNETVSATSVVTVQAPSKSPTASTAVVPSTGSVPRAPAPYADDRSGNTLASVAVVVVGVGTLGAVVYRVRRHRRPAARVRHIAQPDETAFAEEIVDDLVARRP